MIRAFRLAFLSASLIPAASALAQLVSQASFPSGASLVGMAYDPFTDSVWTYASFGADIRHHTAAGAFLGTVPRPGASANDADLDIVTSPFAMSSTPVPAGSLLYIDGESGVAEVYAIDPATGLVIASLTTSFGVSHVVGGAFHPSRGTLFLVQDRVPGGTAANRVAEINPADGSVLQTWQVIASRPTFTVNFGDLEVGANGNLFIVSSDETSVGEFAPDGAFIREISFPTGVNSVCGIGMNEGACHIWVAETGGTVWELGGLPGDDPLCDIGGGGCDADYDQNGVADQDDVSLLIDIVAGGSGTSPLDPDFNCTGTADQDDVAQLIDYIASGGASGCTC